LYSTKLESAEDIIEQFDEVSEGNFQPNEKFKNNLDLNLIGRKQNIQ
jgi:hypothetical protein